VEREARRLIAWHNVDPGDPLTVAALRVAAQIDSMATPPSALPALTKALPSALQQLAEIYDPPKSGDERDD
jgi:hypothetical protein